MPCLTIDDGVFYFDEKIIDAREHHGPLSTTGSVIRGFTAFAGVTSETLNVSHASGGAWLFMYYNTSFFPVKLSLKFLFQICRFWGTKYWVWQNSSSVLAFLVTRKTFLT